ncbi:hypothetical protein GCM10023191_035830 [Actinoallomurus oryzae]|uniref:CAAX protease self-immunity n=1 Tax=Actinoallomurus oryzae TaxID=502180 RepID=A0ABP8PZV8_9ACTN
MKTRTGVLAYLLISCGLSWGYLFTARPAVGLSLVNPLVRLVAVAAAVTVAAALGLWQPDLAPLGVSGLPEWASPLLLMAAVIPLTPFYWGEEFGWTSHLRPRLFAGRPVASVAEPLSNGGLGVSVARPDVWRPGPPMGSTS